MTYTLTVSSQGQIVIPSKVRKQLGLTAGSRVTLVAGDVRGVPVAVLEPAGRWFARLRGIGAGAYGPGEEYIRNARAQWEL